MRKANFVVAVSLFQEKQLHAKIADIGGFLHENQIKAANLESRNIDKRGALYNAKDGTVINSLHLLHHSQP